MTVDRSFPRTAFIDPRGYNRTAIASLLHQVIDLVIEKGATASGWLPLTPVEDLDLSTTIPHQGMSESELLMQLRTVMQLSMNAAQPGYVGHMDSIPTTASIIGDVVAAMLNNNLLSVEMSPVFSRLETLVLRQLAQGFGLGDRAGGLITSGGTLANLHALTVARNVKFPVFAQGLSHLDQQPVFFVSEVAHTSLQKAAMLLGLGTSGAIPVKTNQNAQMDVGDLNHQLHQCQQNGQIPFAIVATAGTTVTGNIDPLPEIGAIAQAHDLWFHVDAAYGGALQFSPDYRHLLNGIEQANSVTFNPQKWLYVAKTCATILFRDFNQLHQNYQIAAPYMDDDNEFPNLGELSIQGTRHADILKLWLSLQHLGREGYARIIEQNYQLTDYFVAQIRDRPYLKLATTPQMNVICFRGELEQLPPEQWDDWNRNLQAELLQMAACFLSLPLYRQQRWLKAVLLNPYTQTEDIDRWFSVCDRVYAQHNQT